MKHECRGSVRLGTVWWGLPNLRFGLASVSVSVLSVSVWSVSVSGGSVWLRFGGACQTYGSVWFRFWFSALVGYPAKAGYDRFWIVVSRIAALPGRKQLSQFLKTVVSMHAFLTDWVPKTVVSGTSLQAETVVSTYIFLIFQESHTPFSFFQ